MTALRMASSHISRSVSVGTWGGKRVGGRAGLGTVVQLLLMRRATDPKDVVTTRGGDGKRVCLLLGLARRRARAGG